MNKLSYLFTATTIFALVIFISCGGDDPGTDPEETAIEKQLKLLVNEGTAWQASAIKQDGVEATEWADFTLSFTGSGNGGNYTTSGRPDAAEVPNVDVVWPASGTWEFADSSTAGEKDPSKIVRSDGAVIDVSATSTKLTLTFEIEEADAGGRIQGVTGTWVFEFNI